MSEQGNREPWRCAGIVGWLRGHNFTPFEGSYNPYDHCVRCGMPVGGWNPINGEALEKLVREVRDILVATSSVKRKSGTFNVAITGDGVPLRSMMSGEVSAS